MESFLKISNYTIHSGPILQCLCVLYADWSSPQFPWKHAFIGYLRRKEKFLKHATTKTEWLTQWHRMSGKISDVNVWLTINWTPEIDNFRHYKYTICRYIQVYLRVNVFYFMLEPFCRVIKTIACKSVTCDCYNHLSPFSILFHLRNSSSRQANTWETTAINFTSYNWWRVTANVISGTQYDLLLNMCNDKFRTVVCRLLSNDVVCWCYLEIYVTNNY